MNKKLAKIKKASLYTHHSILTFSITVKYEYGLHQDVGSFVLDKYEEKKHKRIGTAYGCEVIRQLLLKLKVNDFSEMAGKYVWIYGVGEYMDFKPKAIDLLKVDGGGEPLIFNKIYEEMKDYGL